MNRENQEVQATGGIRDRLLGDFEDVPIEIRTHYFGAVIRNRRIVNWLESQPDRDAL